MIIVIIEEAQYHKSHKFSIFSIVPIFIAHNATIFADGACNT